jgi:hypothetical protein
MTSKHASGLYEYYPGAFSHHPDCNMTIDTGAKDATVQSISAISDAKEQKISLTSVLEGTMTHFREQLCRVDFTKFPAGENLWEAESNAHQMIDEMEWLLTFFKNVQATTRREETEPVIDTAARPA